MTNQATGAPMAPETEDGYVGTPAWGMFLFRILGPRPDQEETSAYNEDVRLSERAA